MPGEIFDGVVDETGRRAMERARARIDEVRKGEMMVRLVDQVGQPGRDAPGPARLSDDTVAAWTVNYYTLAFSKPYIKELVRWFVVDDVGGRGTDAGLVTRTGERKPAFWALKELFQETWSMRWAGELQEGAASFLGFYGTYEVTMEGDGEVEVRIAR